MAKPETKVKKTVKKNVTVGVVHINATFNNTIITITDQQGNTLAWASAGNQGFKGSRKSTPYAGQIAAGFAAAKVKDMGMKIVSVEVKGPGSVRESALRAIQGVGLVVTAIKDTTPIPHNGCRARKRRRV